MSNSGSKFLSGLLFGGAAGFIFGLLTAPKSGAELRKQLRDSSDDLTRTAGDSINGIKQKTEQTIHELQDKGNSFLRKAGDGVLGTKEHLTNKLERMTGQGAQVLVDDGD
jgi:gas vesicle protein